MKIIVKGAVISITAALLLGGSLALSSTTPVSGASRVHPDNSLPPPNSIKCAKGANAYCFTVQNTGQGSAIQATAGSGFGLYSISSSSVGVVGGSTSYEGVEGDSLSSFGVRGFSSGGDGVYGHSDGNAEGGWFQNYSYDYPALLGETDAGKSGYPLEAQAFSGTAETGFFEVDGSGNGYFSDSVYAPGGFHPLVFSQDGERLSASLAMTPQATMEDTGTGRLLEGEAAVRFDPVFASTIDARRGYQVFVTPKGETRGWLYVSAEYEGGFIVREALHGRSSVYFDYRIVARPHNISDERLPRLKIALPKLPRLPKVLPIARPRP